MFERIIRNAVERKVSEKLETVNAFILKMKGLEFTEEDTFTDIDGTVNAGTLDGFESIDYKITGYINNYTGEINIVALTELW